MISCAVLRLRTAAFLLGLGLAVCVLAALGSQAFGGNDVQPPVVTYVSPTGNYVTSYDPTITGTYSDPDPSSGIYQVWLILDSNTNDSTTACTFDGSGNISCSPSGLSWNEEYTATIRVTDNAGYVGTDTGKFTLYAPTRTQPPLGLAITGAGWHSFADYLAGLLSVELEISNNSDNNVFNVQLLGVSNTNGVALETPLPVGVSSIAAGSSAMISLDYHVLAGTGSFRSSFSGSAEDAEGIIYIYP